MSKYKEQILEERLKELNKILRKWSSKYGVEAANDVWEFLLADLQSLFSKTQQATIEEIIKKVKNLWWKQGMSREEIIKAEKDLLDKLKK